MSNQNGSGKGSGGGEGGDGNSGGGGGGLMPINKPKVSKVMVWRNRKINLGNYSSVDLNAGLEIVFEEPVAINDLRIKEAFEEARKVINEEWKKQYEPYQKLGKKVQ